MLPMGSSDSVQIKNRFVIQDTYNNGGSIVFVPSTNSSGGGRLYVETDDAMHVYEASNY